MPAQSSDSRTVRDHIVPAPDSAANAGIIGSEALEAAIGIFTRNIPAHRYAGPAGRQPAGTSR